MSKFLYFVNGIIPFDNVDYIGCDNTDGTIFLYSKDDNVVTLIDRLSQAHLALIMHDLKEFLLFDENLCFDFTKYDKGDDNND